MVGHRTTEKGNTMTVLVDDTLNAIARQLSVAYFPTAREPLPSELKDLVMQLVAFETRKRGIERPTARRLAICYGADGTASSVDRPVNRTTA